MAGPVFSNNAVGTLASAYSASATAITLTAGQGALFPAPATANGEWFAATIVNASNQFEIVKCTARSSDTLTVVRGQEGTAARALSSGDKVEHRLTAGALVAIRDRPLDAAQIPDDSVGTPELKNYSITHAKMGVNPPSVWGDNINPNAVSASHLALGAAAGNLGYNPVRQGGITGQLNNSVNIGWSTSAKLRVAIDSTDVGYLLTEQQNGKPDGGGYRGRPATVMDTDYPIALSDNGRMIVHRSTTSHYYHIPADGNPAFGIGSVVYFVNHGYGNVQIYPDAGVALVWSPSGGLGPRNLATYGQCTLYKIDVNAWYIFGNGIT